MILDFGGGFFLRRATAADHAALCEICLKTGDAGEDATAREDDPALLGMIYAVPYQVLAPDHAFVIDSGNGAMGYLLGTPDTRAFSDRLAAEWYPRLQATTKRPPSDKALWQGSDWARHAIHDPNLAMPPGLAPYPAHGHIDLLPPARGRGIGTRCIRFMEENLRQAGAAGLFLDVHPHNLGAQAFYRTLGYAVIVDDGKAGALFMAKRL